MVDRDFEAHLQDLFDAPAALDDAERFTALIERDIRRMRRTLLLATGLVAAGMAAGIYLAIDPLWSRWSGEAMAWAAQAGATMPYASLFLPIAAALLTAAAVVVGLAEGRRS